MLGGLVDVQRVEMFKGVAVVERKVSSLLRKERRTALAGVSELVGKPIVCSFVG